MSEQRLGDRYELGALITSGPARALHQARDCQLDRPVLVHLLRPDLDNSDRMQRLRQRFRLETDAARKLDHPTIVPVLDAAEDSDSGSFFLVYKPVPGRTLAKLIASGHRLRSYEVARLGAWVAAALDHAHRLPTPVLHTGLSPAWIIVADDGTVRVGGFGLAPLIGSRFFSTEHSRLPVDYLSPEQVAGARAGVASDLFSLGAVLYELATGTRPFPGTRRAQTLAMISRAQPPPLPTSLRPGLPTAFNPLLLTCLEKDLGDRYDSAAELAQALGALEQATFRLEAGDGKAPIVQQPPLPKPPPRKAAASQRAADSGASTASRQYLPLKVHMSVLILGPLLMLIMSVILAILIGNALSILLIILGFALLIAFHSVWRRMPVRCWKPGCPGPARFRDFWAAAVYQCSCCDSVKRISQRS